MSASLVGSEMCIRDSFKGSTILTVAHRLGTIADSDRILALSKAGRREIGCLLYTSDAADDM
eukprot:14736068-Alexandrium_andersonii.AAC.1